MKEITVISIGTHAVGAAIAVGVGWGSPFANRVDPIALRAFTVSVIASLSFVGTLIMCPLIPLMMHKASARAGEKTSIKVIGSNAWIVMRESLGTLALSPLVSGAVTMLLLWVNVPLVPYNLHTLFSCIAVNISSIYMALNYRQFCRRRHAAAPSPGLTQVRPEAVTITHAELRRRSRTRRPSWRRSACRAFRISLPGTITSMVAIQYITISRQVQFDSANAFFIFAVTTSLLKTLLPVVVKFYITKTAVRDSRNMFFMMSAPLFNIEIQLRMAMWKAQATTSLFVTSGFVNVLELVARAVAVAVDLALVRRAEKRLAKNKTQLVAHQHGSSDAEIEARLLILDETHKKWKMAHLRVSAAETIAGMAAEYCGIGLISIFKLVLHENGSIDFPRQPDAGLYRYEAQAWATQVGFEVVTDIVATVVEIQVGIPVLEVITNDAGAFIRWAIAVITAHASGICLSSFIVST